MYLLPFSCAYRISNINRFPIFCFMLHVFLSLRLSFYLLYITFIICFCEDLSFHFLLMFLASSLTSLAYDVPHIITYNVLFSSCFSLTIICAGSNPEYNCFQMFCYYDHNWLSSWYIKEYKSVSQWANFIWNRSKCLVVFFTSMVIHSFRNSNSSTFMQPLCTYSNFILKSQPI